jgi:hypothetical protein
MTTSANSERVRRLRGLDRGDLRVSGMSFDGRSDTAGPLAGL